MKGCVMAVVLLNQWKGDSSQPQASAAWRGQLQRLSLYDVGFSQRMKFDCSCSEHEHGCTLCLDY